MKNEHIICAQYVYTRSKFPQQMEGMWSFNIQHVVSKIKQMLILCVACDVLMSEQFRELNSFKSTRESK